MGSRNYEKHEKSVAIFYLGALPFFIVESVALLKITLQVLPVPALLTPFWLIQLVLPFLTLD
jgi:hypothetical protein